MKTIGVMCYQGGSHLYVDALKNLGFKVLQVYANTDFSKVDGLILPGGESSVQYSYCINNGLNEKIIKYSLSKRPIIGTCAGAILLSKYRSKNVNGFGLIDIDIVRNFYGRQIKSGIIKSDNNTRIVFIRAPGIINTGKNVKILDSYKGSPIFVKQDNIYCTAFHPELGAHNDNNPIFAILNYTNL